MGLHWGVERKKACQFPLTRLSLCDPTLYPSITLPPSPNLLCSQHGLRSTENTRLHTVTQNTICFTLLIYTVVQMLLVFSWNSHFQLALSVSCVLCRCENSHLLLFCMIKFHQWPYEDAFWVQSAVHLVKRIINLVILHLGYLCWCENPVKKSAFYYLNSWLNRLLYLTAKVHHVLAYLNMKYIFWIILEIKHCSYSWHMYVICHTLVLVPLGY